MRYDCSPLNPAGAAIAAVLALAPISAFAQVTDPAAAPPDVVAPQPSSPAAPVQPQSPSLPPVNSGLPPVNSGAPATVFAPSSPVVQPAPAAPVPAPAESPVETSRSAPPVAAPAKRSPTQSQAAPRVESRTSAMDASPPQNAASVPPRSPAITRITPAGATSTQAESPAGSEVTDKQNSAIPSPEPVGSQRQDSGDIATAWALGLGTLAFLGGAGVLALRRRREDDHPVWRQTRPVIIGDGASPVHEEHVVPIAETPARVQAESAGFAPMREGASLAEQREAMVAAAPTPANPFLTRKNRLRRANFFLRHNGASAHAASPDSQTASAAEAPAGKMQVQTVYRISGNQRSSPFTKPSFG